VLLINHIKAGVWLYPGGHIDPNEDPAQAAVREEHDATRPAPTESPGR
jgi:ADP-ribose pyrophosphatase YjhB (NUDIX family)